MKLLIR